MKFRKCSSEKLRRGAAAVVAAVTLLLCAAFPAFAADIPAPSSEFYVNDTSGVLSGQSKSYIVETNEKLRAQTGAQVVVVTVKTLSGDDLNRFATELFRSYGIGDADRNNGVLLLVVTGDRELRIEVGYGLEGAINDAKAGRLLDEYVVPYLADDKWDEGILNGFNAILREIRTEYGLKDAEALGNEPVHYEKSEPGFLDRFGGRVTVAMGLGLIVGLLSGALFKGSGALIANLLWLVAVFCFFLKTDSVLNAGVAVFASGLWQLIGYAVTSPDTGSGGSYSSGRSGGISFSGGRSGGSRSSHSGGGGRSGGGGASRKF